MGNQQERSLGWLAGIIDGEGSITAQVYTMPDGRVRITPFVVITNQDLGIIDKCKEILIELNIKSRWHRRQDGTFNGRIDGEKPVMNFIAIIEPYLWSYKRQNCKILNQYFDLRRKNRFKRNELGQLLRQPYCREEVELISSIRTHHRAKSSEAICLAPNVIG